MLLSLVPVYYIIALTLLQETDTAAFGDLGKLLLFGALAAIVVAFALTFVRLRLRDKRPPTADFISIKSFQVDEDLGSEGHKVSTTTR